MEWILNSKMLIVCLTIIVLGIGKKFERKVYLYALTLYLSTILHELSHYTMAKLMFIKTKGIRLFPTFSKNIEGTVNVDAPRVELESSPNQGFRLIPVALAPLSLFYLAYYVELNWFKWFSPVNLVEYIVMLFVLVYLLAILVYNAIPSWTDLSYILAYPIAFFSWVFIIASVVLYSNNDFLEVIVNLTSAF